MSDLDKNIYRKEEPTPYEKIIVNPIEKDRKGKEEGYTGLKNSTRSQAFAILVSYFRKILNTLSAEETRSGFPGNQRHLIDTVLAFRSHLATLSKDDQSHNPNFTQELSELWHNLLDDCNSLSRSKEATLEIVSKVKFLIAQIENFPQGADHTLGYYFTQYAGIDWIPFPFMELLQQLHEEYSANPGISVLQNWISLLDDVLSTAGSKPE